MGATEKQTAFIETLLRERTVPAGVETEIRALAVLAEATRPQISQVIDQLMRMPRKPAAAAGGVGGRVNPLVAAGIPCARYVLHATDFAGGSFPDTLFSHNDTVFVEVKEFKGTRYMRKLHGAPGGYTRSKPSPDNQALVIKALVDVGALVATRRYSMMYSICSCCGAELTDDRSREFGMGPTCRTRFDLA